MSAMRKKRAASLEEAVQRAIEQHEASKARVQGQLDALVQRMRDSDPGVEDEELPDTSPGDK